MRWIGRLLNPIGFGVAMLCLLLPFASVQLPAEIMSGDFRWTGADLVVGGNVAENLVILRPNGDGSTTPESTNIIEMYGPGYFGAVRFMPGHVAGIVATLLILAGAITPLLAGRRVRAVAAAVVAMGAVAALALAQSQALHHVLRVWLDEIGTKPPELQTSRLAPLPSTAYGFWLVLGLLLALGVTNVALAGFGEARTLRRRTGVAAIDPDEPAQESS